MQCLANNEVSEWLRQHAIQEDPYHLGHAPAYYLQFHAPQQHRQLDAFTRHYYARIISGSASLLHVTDWCLYKPSEMIAIAGIRSSNGEVRLLIEAPGHEIEPSETETGIALFSLCGSFAWTAYLYSPQARTTLYCWEGGIFDFWTDSGEMLAEMRSIVSEFSLSLTCDAEQAIPPNIWPGPIGQHGYR